jgi:anthranilate synthase component 1
LTERNAVSKAAEAVNLLALHRHAPQRYPFLLQSTAHDNSLGRYDILFACPGDELVLDAPGRGGFLAALDDWWREERITTSNSSLPFTGGWFLYLGYELAGEVEPALQLNPDPVMPVAFAVRCPAAVVYDHQTGQTHIATEDPRDEIEALIEADISACGTVGIERPGVAGEFKTSEEPAAGFLDAVLRAKEYIAEGDIYQANLSREWSTEIGDQRSAEQIYAALCTANPGPFAGLVRWRDNYVISSSPERLLKISGGVASTRPIAGTRPRSDDQATDDSLSEELFAHPKERAEHVMLIDLERNDLGRVSEPGSVEVDEMMVLESYAHVHHIVSNVQGRLRDDVTPGDAIRAVFPGGTITGCPKVRCMQIISELEAGPRGAYTGSFGYLNRDGSLDLNILIRTMVLHDNRISLRAGSGIVADSDAVAELAETRAKAKGLLQALSQ